MEEVYLRIFLMQIHWNQESLNVGWSVTSPGIFFSFLKSSWDDICWMWVTVALYVHILGQFFPDMSCVVCGQHGPASPKGLAQMLSITPSASKQGPIEPESHIKWSPFPL